MHGHALFPSPAPFSIEHDLEGRSSLLFLDPLTPNSGECDAIRETIYRELNQAKGRPLTEEDLIRAFELAHKRQQEIGGGAVSALIVTEIEPSSPFLIVAGVGDSHLYGILPDQAEVLFCDPYQLDQHGMVSIEKRGEALQNALGIPGELDVYCRKLSRSRCRYLVAMSYGAYIQLSDDDWFQIDLSLGSIDQLLTGLISQKVSEGHLVSVVIADPSSKKEQPLLVPLKEKISNSSKFTKRTTLIIGVGLLATTLAFWGAKGSKEEENPPPPEMQTVELSTALFEKAKAAPPLAEERTQSEPLFSELQELRLSLEWKERAIAILRNQLQQLESGSDLANLMAAQRDAYLSAIADKSRIEEAFNALQERQLATAARLSAASRELDGLRSQLFTDGRSVEQIVAAEETAREALADAERGRQQLRYDLEQLILARAQESLELKSTYERLYKLEEALAEEKYHRERLEQMVALLKERILSIGVEIPGESGQLLHVNKLIAEAEQELDRKMQSLYVQEEELAALYQAYDDLKCEYHEIAELSERRGTALSQEQSRRQALESALLDERQQRAQLEALAANRLEQERLLVHLRDAQLELSEQVERLSDASLQLQREKAHLELEIEELFTAARSKERALIEVAEQNSELASLLTERDRMLRDLQERNQGLEYALHQGQICLNGPQEELEQTLLQMSEENLSLQKRLALLEKSEDDLLYRQLVDNLREQREVISSIEGSRQELIRELEELKHHQAGRWNEMADISIQERDFDKARSGVTQVNGHQPVRIHMVKKGETLSSISQRYYGTSSRWREIADANRETIREVDKIPAGTPLIIPQ